MMGLASLLEGATASASDACCGRRKYMTVRIRRNVSSTNKIDIGVAPCFACDMCGRQSRSCSTVASARGVQIDHRNDVLVLKELASQCRLGEGCTTAFCMESAALCSTAKSARPVPASSSSAATTRWDGCRGSLRRGFCSGQSRSTHHGYNG